MKMRNYILLSLSLWLCSTLLWAQEGVLRLNLNYAVGIPVGNMKTISDNVSGRGLEAALTYGVNEQLSVGLQLGHQDFYKKFPRQLFHESGSDLSAVVTNSVQVLPFMLKGKYYFSQGVVRPFASLAAGGNLISYKKYYGQFSDEKNKLGFAAQPELGMYLPVGLNKRWGITLAAAYNFMPFEFNDADGLSHAVIKAGFAVPLR